MKGNNHFRRHGAVLAWFLAVYTVLSVIPASPPFSARAAAAYKSGSSIATPSSATPEYPSVTPTSSVPDRPIEITYLDAPDLIVLETGQTDSTAWQSHFPGQAEGWATEGGNVLCRLEWSVSHMRWDRPGLYTAEAKIIPPDGYFLSDYMDKQHNAVVSIHPPGKSQVIDVYTSMGFWGLKGHTWTFAMKVGQDMTPLIEELENKTEYMGMLDTTNETIRFTADWDFSAVTPEKPGLYRIHRRLSLVEDSLPEGLSKDDIFLSDYWKELPVLFSVEEPDGPQLYGVLENPYEFFGSYARLSDEELNRLEVWYSVGGGTWTLQTDEGLMEVEQKDFRIFKSEMKTGQPYSFRLKLGDHVSRELTVQKEKTSPVWFSWTLGGNRDGTIDIDFPDISQPPPEPPDSNETTAPEYEETTPPVSNGAIETGGQVTSPPESSDPIETKEPETSSPESDSSIETEEPETSPPEPGSSVETEEPEASSFDSNDSNDSDDSDDSDDSENENMETSAPQSSPPSYTITASPPEEIVTRWTSQISGKRVHKLLEMYSEWILFQKEEVSVLLSSEWLESQELKDSDVLTVEVSPEADHSVSVLINQKAPENPPVFQVEINQQSGHRPAPSKAAAIGLSLMICSGIFLCMKGRWKK